MKHIAWHADDTRALFFRRTISAQLHFGAALAAILGFAVLTYFVQGKKDGIHLWASLIYGLTSICVFAASTVYHFLSDGFAISEKLRQLAKDLDHSSIFIFIAGSYTPFTINTLAAPWDQIILFLIWTIGTVGVGYVFFRRKLPVWARNRLVYTSIFLLMGWTVLIRIAEALSRLSFAQTALLVGGGLFYTVGAVIYALKWPNPFPKTFGFHEIWHVMVVLGFAFHYFMILSFYWPMG